MQLGILNACTPQDEEEFQAEEFQNFDQFFALADHGMTLIEYRITEGEFPRTTDECDAYLITGSPKGVYDDEGWIGQLGDFIRDSYLDGKKLVGICFGHQMLAHSLGGHTEKSSKGWGIGPNTVEIAKLQPWMAPRLPQGNFYFCHQDQVMRLPEGAIQLAGNAFCPNGMFIVGKQVLGLQAHPEFTANVMHRAIELLRPMVEEEQSNIAEVRTSERQVDNEIMAQWIVNFLMDTTTVSTAQPL
ncbi:MAG: GMP synthase [Chloroflexota bacterium]